MRIEFDFGDLEAFLAVADLGSFQRAADTLNISQSALTRRIQKLEKSLGVSLFERTTRSLKLTLAAKGFRHRAQVMVDDAAETMLSLRDESSRFEHQRNAMITIATAATISHYVFPAAIRQFRAEGYKARIRVLDHLASNIIDSVAEGDADFGISVAVAEEPGLAFRILMEESFVLAMRREDPLCAQETVRWADIDETRLIAPWKGTGNRMLIDNALAHTGRVLGWTYEARHSATTLGLVEAGVGVAVVPQSAAPQDDSGRAITARRLVEPEVQRTIGLLRRTGRAMPPAAERFFNILSEIFTANTLPKVENYRAAGS